MTAVVAVDAFVCCADGALGVQVVDVVLKPRGEEVPVDDVEHLVASGVVCFVVNGCKYHWQSPCWYDDFVRCFEKLLVI